MTVTQHYAGDLGVRPSPALQAVRLHRRFSHPGGDVDVLRGADLAAYSGEIVTITGRSGSGKSCLMALLSGFDTPDHGTVLLDGQPAGTQPPWHSCAVLPQALGLSSELTSAENVALPLRLRPGTGQTELAAVDAVGALLDELGLAELADRYPTELSFGQQQRVALARAVATPPAVLLVDEPTAHLDAASTQAVLTLLRGCADEDVAVVAVTHDPEVERIADRRLRLHEGVLVEE